MQARRSSGSDHTAGLAEIGTASPDMAAKILPRSMEEPGPDDMVGISVLFVGLGRMIPLPAAAEFREGGVDAGGLVRLWICFGGDRVTNERNPRR